MTMVIMIIAVVMMMTYDQVIMMVINNDVYFQLKEFSDYVLLVKYLYPYNFETFSSVSLTFEATVTNKTMKFTS